MTRHVFKLVWNRKRSTGLILVELLICFLVLCGIMTSVVNRSRNTMKRSCPRLVTVEIILQPKRCPVPGIIGVCPSRP